MTRWTSSDTPVCRVGFVGTGGVAARHATVLSGFGDVELVAATDTDGERAGEFGRRFGLAADPDVAALLGRGLDAVYVCVPPFAHGALEEKLSAAGVALFVEKPLGVDDAVADRIAGTLAAAGTLTRVGHHWRCAEPVVRARELLAGRTVRLVGGAWLDKVPPVGWWTDAARSGGPLVEQAVHLLDTARVLVGDITEVYALSAGAVAGGSVDAATAAVLRFASGAAGTLTTTCVLSGKHRAGLEIVADDLVVGVGEDWLEVDGTRTAFDPWPARIAADRAFVDAVLGAPTDPDRSPPDYADALRSHHVACALARSAAAGRPEQVR